MALSSKNIWEKSGERKWNSKGKGKQMTFWLFYLTELKCQEGFILEICIRKHETVSWLL